MEPESVMTDNLLPCPFCGERAHMHAVNGPYCGNFECALHLVSGFNLDAWNKRSWQAARTVPEWISVTDRLPEQDVSFLAVTDCGGDIYISTMRLTVLISKNSKPDGDFIRERVTHWMPLPAAPEPKK